MHTIGADVPVPRQQPAAFLMSRGKRGALGVRVIECWGVGWASCPRGLFVYPQCLAGPDVVIWGMNEALFVSGMRRFRLPHFRLQLLPPNPNPSLIIFAVTLLSIFFFLYSNRLTNTKPPSFTVNSSVQ